MKGQPRRPSDGGTLPPQPLPTCSSTTARQQRVRFLTTLLGSPRVARELQSWLRFLPSVETGEGTRAGWEQPPAHGSPNKAEPWGCS